MNLSSRWMGLWLGLNFFGGIPMFKWNSISFMNSRWLRFLGLLSMGASICAAESAMGLYEGFWTTPDGKKGRVTAQVRPIAQGKFDGFVALYRAKNFNGALKLKPA